MSRPSKPKGPCLCGCGEIAETRGYSHRCYARFADQGFPEGGPRPPLSASECGRRSGQARSAEAGYDQQWAASEPERRILRAVPYALALARCESARDAKGVHELRHRIRDWEAVAAVLARRASLAAAGLGAVAAHIEPLTLVPALSGDSGAMEDGEADAAA